VKTDELISLLASGTDAVDRGAQRKLSLLAMAVGLLASAMLVAFGLGIHPDLSQETRQVPFWLREVFCAAIGGMGLVCVRRLVLPGTRLGLAPLGVAAPAILMLVLAAAVLIEAEPQRRAALIFGQTARVCPLLIALVAAPIFVAVIWSMRRFAPTRLRLAGAAAGLAAGGAGALVYTLHCPELAPPFLAVWYVLGMLIPAASGALLGPRLLRW
jgi:hypothetical protein